MAPSTPATYLNRASACAEQGKFDQAIADFDKTIELDQKYADAYYWRSRCLKQQGRNAPALTDSQAFLELGNNTMDREHVEQWIREFNEAGPSSK